MPPKVHPGEIIKMDVMEPLDLDSETAAGLSGIPLDVLFGVNHGATRCHSGASIRASGARIWNCSDVAGFAARF